MSMKRKKYFYGISLVTAAITYTLLSTGYVAAQTPATSDTQASSTSTSASSIDDSKLDQFVGALVAVQAVQKEAATKQTTAADPDAAKSIHAEAQAKMTKAVQDSGLQVDEFNNLVQLMTADADIRTRINTKLQQRQGAG